MQNSIRTLLIFRLEYIEALISKGHDVHCIAPIDDILAAQTLEQIGATVSPIPARSLIRNSLAMNRHHRRLYRASKGQLRTITHFLTTVVMTFPSLLFSRHRNLVVIEGLGSFLHSKKFVQPIFRIILQAVATQSIFMNRFEKAKIGTDKNIVLNGIGVPLDDFVQLTPSSRKTGESIKLLYVGRLIADKGVHDVIDVFSSLHQQGKDYKLHLVGDVYPNNPSSLTNKQIEEITSRFGDAITFHGFQRNIIDYYRNCDVLLLLSKHEGFPVVVMEANACGIPVVAYDVPGCNEAVSQGVNGFLVDYGDTHSVAKVLTDIQPEKYKDSCVEYAKLHFDRRKKNERLIHSLAKL
ncbi:MAG: glycosyltransferase [Granulosicoccus sp.]